jgi:hypothetical protein
MEDGLAVGLLHALLVTVLLQSAQLVVYWLLLLVMMILFDRCSTCLAEESCEVGKDGPGRAGDGRLHDECSLNAVSTYARRLRSHRNYFSSSRGTYIC